MKTKFNGILTLLLALVVQISFAQDKTISGTVSDESGPLPGVSVLKKGTNKGTETDFDGKYSIKAKAGDVLVFSFVGMDTVEKTVGASNSINVSMATASDNVLEEVVVTALGIKKEKKTLGYAVTELKAEAVEQKPQSDVARALNGQVAGVNIVGSGGATGGSTNINIRTNISINGNNQPLFIVDGVPFQSDENGLGNFTEGSQQSGNRFLDINPDDIASISVLKGLSAANLYGSRGRNGVVLITTKSGNKLNKKFEVTISNTAYITQIANLPDYQNTYGQGADQVFNPGFVGNWGASFNSINSVIHPYANGRNSGFDKIFPQFFGIEVPYKAATNNVKDFFREGIGRTTTISAASGFENGNINFSYNNTEEEGYIPENRLNKNSFRVSANTKLNNKFRIGGSLNFVKTFTKSPPITAGNATNGISIFERLLFVPRNLDLTNLPYQNPATGASVYYRPDIENPYWLVANSSNSSTVRRTYGNFNVGYDFNDHISANFTYGLDTYTDKKQFYVNKGGVSRTEYQVGYLRTTNIISQLDNYKLLLNFNDYSINENLKFNFLLGGEMRSDSFSRNGVTNTNQVVFGRINSDNFLNSLSRDPVTDSDLEYDRRLNVLGVFGEARFEYKNYLYATVSGRKDWTSNISKNLRSIFYPSFSVSFIPTSAFDNFKSDFLNFLKVRGSYATSAGFPSEYPSAQSLRSVANEFVDSSGNSTTTNALDRQKANPDLRPELHTEFEIGLEGLLWDKRINFDISAYKRISKDQILTQNLDPASGFTRRKINAGRIDAEGIEIGFGVKPIRNENFTWSIQNNFSASETLVKDIPQDRIIYSGFTNLGNAAIKGQPLGVIMGSYYARDKEGNILVDASNSTTQGRYITSNDVNSLPNIKVIGDPNPDWKLTSINSFSYKDFSLSAQLEYTHGGDVYSLTNQLLLLRGVTKDTEDRESTFILPGVLGNPNTGLPILDSNGKTIPNTVQIGANDIYFQNVFRANEAAIWDASTLRIRDITLSYKMPKKAIENTPFGSISFALSARNIWYKAFNMPKHTNFDPEVLSTGSGNGLGLDFMTEPTSRRYSFSIKATF